MTIVDLFCKAGGASQGLHLAFPDAKILGIDIKPQPHYPFTFLQMDALDVPLDGVNFVWASPPCQRYSQLTRVSGKPESHADLIEATRNKLIKWGGPYVIENVVGAPLENPIRLCGSMFGLQTKAGNQLQRHRLFECSWRPWYQPLCHHNRKQVVGVYGHAGGRSKRDGLTFFSTKDWQRVMGIDWMNGEELAEAIPPAYAQYIGESFINYTKGR